MFPPHVVPSGASLFSMLAGEGSRVIHLFVTHSAVPERPPQSFEGLVEPVRTSRGEVVDWQLHATDTRGFDELWRDFRNWRSTFVTDRSVGTVAAVTNFLDWAEHRVDVSALGVLRLPTARLETRAIVNAEYQLQQARSCWRESTDIAWGIVATERTTLLRGLVPTNDEQLLLDERDASLWLRPDGLELRAEELPAGCRVFGWDLRKGELTLESLTGLQTLSVDPVAGLLRSVAATAPVVRVQQVPLTKVFGPMLAPVFELTRLAINSGGVLHVRRGPF